MRWEDGRRSDNVEDRRSVGFSGKAAAGGGIGTIVLVLVAMYFGIDPSFLTQTGLIGGGSGQTQQVQRTPSAEENKKAEFVKVVLADTEDTWSAIFKEKGGRYQEPTLVLFSGMVQSACGSAGAAVGPFYCPGDRKVYIDLDFYNDLKNKLGAPGDFAQAYVIAHEIGHHVQNLLGISDQVQKLRGRLSAVDYNKYQVKLELQADCFAGIWANQANRARHIIEPGDIDEALNAASMIGDDRLQKRARGYVTPDSFTHGTSAQRVAWFKRGYEHGTFESCDTFNSN